MTSVHTWVQSILVGLSKIQDHPDAESIAAELGPIDLQIWEVVDMLKGEE